MIERTSKIDNADCVLDEDLGDSFVDRIENAISLCVCNVTLYRFDGYIFVHGDKQAKLNADKFYEGYKMGWEDCSDMYTKHMIERARKQIEKEKQSSMTDELNINVYQQGEKTAELTCNWCGEVHAVEPEYREEILRKGIGHAAEFELTTGIKLAPDETWTCGKCLLVLYGYPPDYRKTDCHEHEVPKERVVK